MKVKTQDLTFFGIALVSFVFVENLYVRSIIIASLLVWLLMEFYERGLLSKMDTDETIIYCEWDGKLNETDFSAAEERTIECFKDIGENLDSALGNEYVFHTENSKGKDIYFPGKLQKTEDGTIVIRANSKIYLQ